MADVKITDPLNRQIILHQRTWAVHVTKNHPEMAAHRAVAEEAIRSPIEIQVSKSDPDCRLYYGKGPRPKVMIVVVADVVGGFVKTSYLARKLGTGDIEWS